LCVNLKAGGVSVNEVGDERTDATSLEVARVSDMGSKQRNTAPKPIMMV